MAKKHSGLSKAAVLAAGVGAAAFAAKKHTDHLAYYRLSRGIPESGDLQRIINRPKRYLKSNLIRGCEFDRNKIYEACTKNASRQECLRINDTVNDMFLDFRTLSKIDNPTQFINYIYSNMNYEESLYE